MLSITACIIIIGSIISRHTPLSSQNQLKHHPFQKALSSDHNVGTLPELATTFRSNRHFIMTDIASIRGSLLPLAPTSPILRTPSAYSHPIIVSNSQLPLSPPPPLFFHRLFHFYHKWALVYWLQWQQSVVSFVLALVKCDVSRA